MKKILLTLLGIFLFYSFAISQISHEEKCDLILEGKVVSVEKHEAVPFANIYQEKTLAGVVTDSDGHFRMEGLCLGHLHLVVSHINYEPQKFLFDLERDSVVILELNENIKLLSTITVVGEHEVIDAGYARVSLSSSTLDQLSGKSLGDALEAVTGVTTLKTGPGISKPMIHGLYGNRIRIINNGLRQEGQQWGNEHAPEVDPFAADKITVVKGASVVKYGAEAISGAILVEPSSLPEDHHVHGELNLVGMTNGRMGVAAAKLEGGFGDSDIFRWRVQGTYKIAGDFKTPNYFLTNTGIRENNFSIGLGSNGQKVKTELFYSFFDTEIGILRGSHIGNLTDLEDALTRDVPLFTSEEFSYEINNPRQKVKHHVLKAKGDFILDNGNTITAIYGFQHNNRKEFDIRRGGRSDRPALDLTLPSHSIDLKWNRDFTPYFSSELGTRYTYQVNTNDPNTGVRPLIPDYQTYRPGIFWIGKLSRQRVSYEFGAAYDYQYLGVKRFDQDGDLQKPEHRFHNLALSVGGSFNLSRLVRYNVNFGYAMRAPNINELYSEGLHHGAAAIEEGDPNLDQERSFKNIHTFTIFNDDLYSFEISGYYHLVDDFIYLQPQPEPRLTIRGAFPVYKYLQTRANIWGLDVGGRLKIVGSLFWETKASTVHGRNVTENKYLINMPADRWKNMLTYRFKPTNKTEDFEVSIGGLQVWKQNRTPQNPVDPEEQFDSIIDYYYAVYEDFLPPPDGYFLFDIEAGITLKLGDKRLKFHTAIRNVANTNYRDYLNRMRYFADDIGRNVELRIKYIF